MQLLISTKKECKMSLVGTYEPINTLKPVAENIWIVDGPIIHMQQFGLNVPFPTRMTIIRLGDGSLFLHSPTSPDESLLKSIDGLGPVKHLVSPNKIHYASIHPWSQHYPDAKCWASPGVRERTEKHGIEIHFNQNLTDSPEEIWASELDQLIFRGGRFMDEVVFFHKSSRTLILADLIENFERSKLKEPIGWLVKLAGNLDPDGKLPIDLRMTYWGRHKIACKYLRRMIDWQPERIILSHGRWYEKNGAKELKRAFRWLSCSL